MKTEGNLQFFIYGECMKIKYSNFIIKGNKQLSMFNNKELLGKIIITNNVLNISFIDEINNKYFGVFNSMILNHLFKKFNYEQIIVNDNLIKRIDFYFINKYDTFLFDIDDTILDFVKAEKNALTIALSKVGLKVTPLILKDYHEINTRYWDMYYKGIISRKQCLIDRFKEFFEKYNINEDPVKFDDFYRSFLNDQAFIKKDAKTLLKKLNKKNYNVYAITNGVLKIQKDRMKKANINRFFIKSYISDEMGVGKPDIKFIEYIDNEIHLDYKKSLIIGDLISSDIKLGNNCNIDTCWLNNKFEENDSNIKPTYTINLLKELVDKI